MSWSLQHLRSVPTAGAAGTVGLVLAFSLAGCGGGGNEATSSVCAKVVADGKALAKLTPKSAAEAGKDFQNVADTFAADAKNAKDSAVKKNVNDVAGQFRVVGTALAGENPPLKGIQTSLQKAVTQLQKSCPAIS